MAYNKSTQVRKPYILKYRNSKESEFVIVYGRRRVGKTFLINEVLGDGMVFHHTGLSPYDRKRKVSLKAQLQNFHFSLIRHGLEGIAQPKSSSSQ